MKRASQRVGRPLIPNATLTQAQLRGVAGGFDGLDAKADVVTNKQGPSQQ
jgi:hypothetical protein